jgi:Ca-activated chloride channel family protein
MPIAVTTAVASQASAGGWLVSPEGWELALRDAALRVEAAGGLARSVLVQHFANPYDEPLRLRYALPLPADGAVAGFCFRIGEHTVRGEIRSREAARERYEQALVEGRTAALVEEERANLFTQELGNVPPRTDVTVEITVDQPLAWLAGGRWEYRFPTVAAPRYLGAPGRINDAARVALPVAAGDLPARLTLALAVSDQLRDGAAPESPSHAIRVEAREPGVAVSLATASGVPLDRDVVVRWTVGGGEPGVRLEVARPQADHPRADSAFGLLSIVPPVPDAQPAPVARDLIVLLDVSGSMTGEPLAQAVALVGAVVDTLGERDTLEMIAFSTRAERWRSAPARMEPAARAAAQLWLRGLQASGGTEMVDGLREALAPRRGDAQRQVMLVTDGLIGFEGEAIRHVVGHLPAGARLHTIGVGPAVNRALTLPLARAGRGAEVVVGADEPVAAAVERLVALTTAPLAVDLEVGGAAVRGATPRRLPDVMAGTPCLAVVALEPAGGEVIVRGRLGGVAWERRVTAPAVECGAGSPAVLARWAREEVADAEVSGAAGSPEAEQMIERLGLEFGIATRRTSWVAVSDEVTVDPTRPTRRVEIPQALSVGLSATGLGVAAGRLAMHGGMEHLLGQVYGAAEDSVTEFRFHRTLSARRSTAAPRRLVGRLVLQTPSRLVIEFDVESIALAWRPKSAVRLFLASHGTHPAVIADRESTAPGRIEPGRTVRLVVTLDGALPAPLEKVVIDLDGAPASQLLIAIESA